MHVELFINHNEEANKSFGFLVPSPLLPLLFFTVTGDMCELLELFSLPLRQPRVWRPRWVEKNRVLFPRSPLCRLVQGDRQEEGSL